MSDDKSIEQLKSRTERIFNKYKNEYNLNNSQSTGKVLYELENTFEESRFNELTVYEHLITLNREDDEVINYLKDLYEKCLQGDTTN